VKGARKVHEAEDEVRLGRFVRTGKFRPDAVDATRIRPEGIISSIAQLPDWLEEHG